MGDITIREYIGKAMELTAEEVRKLPIGATVIQHKFDRHGFHCTREWTIVQSGKKKMLRAVDHYRQEVDIVPIKKESDRMCYTDDRCCCNCVHDIRTWKKGYCECHCEADGHYIGYADTFIDCCDKWEEKR